MDAESQLVRRLKRGLVKKPIYQNLNMQEWKNKQADKHATAPSFYCMNKHNPPTLTKWRSKVSGKWKVTVPAIF